MPILANTNAFCVAPRTSAKLMREWGVVDDRLREVQPGDAVEVGDVRISVHGAADPGEPGAVTYVLSSGGTTLFVSGDTAGCPALAEVGASRPDYALLAFGRTWYMSEEEMLAAATATSRRARYCPFTGSSGATTRAISRICSTSITASGRLST